MKEQKLNWITRRIIKWSLNTLKPILPGLGMQTYEELERLGISDIVYNKYTEEFAVYLD